MRRFPFDCQLPSLRCLAPNKASKLYTGEMPDKRPKVLFIRISLLLHCCCSHDLALCASDVFWAFLVGIMYRFLQAYPIYHRTFRRYL